MSKIRYFLHKRLASGRVAYYWNPPKSARQAGMVAEALGTDLKTAERRAEQLNLALDEMRAPPPPSLPHGTVAWAIRQYQENRAFKGLRPSTQRVYEQALDRIEAVFGRVRVEEVTNKHADKFYDYICRPRKDGDPLRLSSANATIRVARRLWSVLLKKGMISVQGRLSEGPGGANPFRDVELTGTEARQVRWTRDQVLKFVEAADAAGQTGIASAALLAFFFNQREGDVLALQWDNIDGSFVRMRQSKTGADVILTLRGFPKIQARLADVPRVVAHVVLQPDGRPWCESQHAFRHRFRQIAVAAGLPSHLQFRDLRRSGMTESAEAGNTCDELRIQSGHKTRQIVNTYVVKTDTLAERAMAKRVSKFGGY